MTARLLRGGSRHSSIASSAGSAELGVFISDRSQVAAVARHVEYADMGLSNGRGVPKAELLAIGRRAGYAPTSALVDDYVKRGLLDVATRSGRGRGGGVGGEWDSEQVQLFLEILRRRAIDGTDLRVLLNIPVGMWLVFGDSYVPTRQAHRAMEQFVKSLPRQRGLRRSTKRAISQFAAAGSTADARANLEDALVEYARSGTIAGSDTIPLLDDVLLSGPRDQTDAVRLADLYRKRSAVINRFGEVGLWRIEWARAAWWWARKDYSETWRELAADARFGMLHEAPSLEGLFQSACADVLQLLGFALEGDDRSFPPPLKFQPWRTEQAQLRVTTALIHQQGLRPPRPGGVILGATITVTESGPRDGR